MRASFLSSDADDRELEARNRAFWDALLARIRGDGFDAAPATVVDVGSHLGGLLELIVQRWGSQVVYGIEPIELLRKQALLRLRGQAREVHMLDPEEWSRVPTGAVNLVVAMESFQFVGNVAALVGELARVLVKGGRVYAVLGCHAENPVWPAWREQLRQMGHAVFTHSPLDVLRIASEHGFSPAVCRLRTDGWVIHDPRETTFAFESVEQMLDHHFRHKLLFRFEKR